MLVADESFLFAIQNNVCCNRKWSLQTEENTLQIIITTVIYSDQNWSQYSKWDGTRDLYKGIIIYADLLSVPFLIIPSIAFSFFLWLHTELTSSLTTAYIE